MEQIWQRIEAWLARNAPAVLVGLRPPATEEQIQQLEEALSIVLPPDVRASFLIHDGQSERTPGLIDAWELLSLARVRQEWEVWKGLLDEGTFEDNNSEPDDGVRDNWWNAKWIPLTYSGSGDHHCLDLDPAPEGTSGQIIVMWHDGSERDLFAPCFKDWLEALANDLEADRYVYSEEYFGVMLREDI